MLLKVILPKLMFIATLQYEWILTKTRPTTVRVNPTVPSKD